MQSDTCITKYNGFEKVRKKRTARSNGLRWRPASLLAPPPRPHDPVPIVGVVGVVVVRVVMVVMVGVGVVVGVGVDSRTFEGHDLMSIQVCDTVRSWDVRGGHEHVRASECVGHERMRKYS